MRLQKLIVVSILFFFPILSMPAASSALTITFQGCSPLVPCPAVCTMTVPGGVISIQVPVCDSNGSPTGAFFTIGSPDSPAMIEAIRSADSHQISIQQLGITSNSTSQSTLTITVTSDLVDFQPPGSAPLPPGTYPAGISWSGSFMGPAGTDLTGDSIVATGFALNDAINQTPPGSQDQGPSLPRSCQGNPVCEFSSPNGIFDDVTEELSIQCFAEGEEFFVGCQRSLSLSPLTITFRPPGDSIELFLTLVQSSLPNDRTPLRRALLMPFDAFSAALNLHEERFELWSAFTLNPESNGIDPEQEFVNLRIGSFSTAIPAGSFKQAHKRGGTFFFTGVIRGVHLSVAIHPLGDPAFRSFVFWAKGEGADLAGIKDPVTVQLMIGNDSGHTVAVRLHERREAEDH